MKTAQNRGLTAKKKRICIHPKGERKAMEKEPFSGIMEVTIRKGLNEKMAHQKIIYQLTDKRIPAASGIGMVGDILERAAFLKRFRDVKLAEKRSRKQIYAGAVMATSLPCCAWVNLILNMSVKFRMTQPTTRMRCISTKAFHHLLSCVREWTR